MKSEKNTFISFIVVLTFFLLIHNFVSTLDARADNSPVEIIKARNQAVEKILNKQTDVDQATKEKLKDVINSFIDFHELSRLALGKYWKERSKQERQDFVNTFSQLIKNSSVKKLEIYKADKIEYEEAEFKNDKVKVNTIAYKGRKQVEILYKMHKIGEDWWVYDIEIDGVSTARNYRDSFYKQIAKSSYQEMYNKLTKKLAKK